MKNTGRKFMRSHLLVGTSSQLSLEDFENKAGLTLRLKKKCFSPQILRIKWWINKVDSPQYITSFKRFTSAFVLVRNVAFFCFCCCDAQSLARLSTCFNKFVGFFLPNSNLYLFLSPEREVEGSASSGLSTEIHHHNRLGPSSVTTVKH